MINWKLLKKRKGYKNFILVYLVQAFVSHAQIKIVKNKLRHKTFHANANRPATSGFCVFLKEFLSFGCKVFELVG